MFLILQPNVDRCLMQNQKTKSRAKPLTLVDMTSAFIVLGLGLSLSHLHTRTHLSEICSLVLLIKDHIL